MNINRYNKPPARKYKKNPEEFEDSFLYIEDISEKDDSITYLLRWVVRDYATIGTSKIYCCHHIRIGGTIHQLNMMKSETNSRDIGCKDYSFFLGLTPPSSCAKVSFVLTGIRNEEILPEDKETLGFNLRHSGYDEFPEYRLPKEYTDIPVLCKITVSKIPTVSVRIETGSYLLNFEEFYNNELFSDVQICVGDKDFNVHKVVIGARSPVFLAMLKNEMKESSENRIEIKDSNQQAVAEFLKYLYSEKTIPLSVTLALDLFELADKYDVPTLKLETVSYLRCNFSVENILDILVAADLHNEKVLKREAIEFVSNNLWRLLKSPKWKTFRTHLEIVDCILAYLS